MTGHIDPDNSFIPLYHGFPLQNDENCSLMSVKIILYLKTLPSSSSKYMWEVGGLLIQFISVVENSEFVPVLSFSNWSISELAFNLNNNILMGC